MCKAEGRITVATVCDHIKPHKGEWSKFFDYRNVQSLCAPCHDRHKQSEERRGYSSQVGADGWPIDDRHPANTGKIEKGIGLGQISHPEWFRPMFVPLTIVCGPPASGKTSYVASHKGPRDLVFDLDAIATELHRKPMSKLDGEQRIQCLKARNERMANLMWAKARGTCDRAWLIVSEPSAAKREWWDETLKPEQIIVMATPAETCIARAKADTRQARSRNVDQTIRKWWSEYTPRANEIIVTG